MTKVISGDLIVEVGGMWVGAAKLDGKVMIVVGESYDAVHQQISSIEEQDADLFLYRCREGVKK